MSRERDHERSSSRSRDYDRDREYDRRDRDYDRRDRDYDRHRDRRDRDYDRDYDRRDRDRSDRDRSDRDRSDRDRSDRDKYESRSGSSRSESHHDDRTHPSRSYDQVPGVPAPISSFDPMMSHQQKLQQDLAMQRAMTMSATVPSQANKKQRELYIGNLAIGLVQEAHLRELFNKALAALVPNPVAHPPVMNAQVSGEGKFAFVELRTEDLASAAMFLDKFELFGRSLNVGRPRGYVPPPMPGMGPGGPGGW